jgi:hypothetical protein
MNAPKRGLLDKIIRVKRRAYCGHGVCANKFLILSSADERKSLRHREILDEKWSGARGWRC